MNRLGWFVVIACISVVAIAVHDISSESAAIGAVADTSSAQMIAANSPTDDSFLPSDFHENHGVDSLPINKSKIESDAVNHWMSATTDKDPSERDAADDALAKSPRGKVLPALHHMILNGSTDQRQLALNALRVLALKQGDEDGEIQNMLRLTSYDGDGALAGEAQLVLEDIESASPIIR